MNRFYAIEVNNKYGFIDNDGHVVIDPKYDCVLSTYFSENLCPIQIDNMCGFIDLTGNLKIKPEYDEVTDFMYGLSAVSKFEKWGYINKDGEVIIPLVFDDACCFSQDELATVKLKNKWGYINKLGEFIISPQFDEAYDFDGSLAKVIINEKFGYINRQGNIIWFQKD